MAGAPRGRRGKRTSVRKSLSAALGALTTPPTAEIDGRKVPLNAGTIELLNPRTAAKLGKAFRAIPSSATRISEGGKKVRTMLHGSRSAPFSKFRAPGRDTSGGMLGRGIYMTNDPAYANIFGRQHTQVGNVRVRRPLDLRKPIDSSDRRRLTTAVAKREAYREALHSPYGPYSPREQRELYRALLARRQRDFDLEMKPPLPPFEESDFSRAARVRGFLMGNRGATPELMLRHAGFDSVIAGNDALDPRMLAKSFQIALGSPAQIRSRPITDPLLDLRIALGKQQMRYDQFGR